jgi:predicted RNA-binding Zn-ribbon protein involved in translation (DUF1610 family)
MEAFTAGMLAGAGSFRCDACGSAIAFQEGDEVPPCPGCGGTHYTRARLFGSTRSPDRQDVEGPPLWLDAAREEAPDGLGWLAYEDDGVQVLSLSVGWNRLGRSLAADLRLDDPTVSRRHALIFCDDTGARVLDDRSLNGVFVNGERVELTELEDGDELAVGRYRLYFLTTASVGERSTTAGVAG